jgi:hypothetical protein
MYLAGATQPLWSCLYYMYVYVCELVHVCGRVYSPDVVLSSDSEIRENTTFAEQRFTLPTLYL